MMMMDDDDDDDMDDDDDDDFAWSFGGGFPSLNFRNQRPELTALPFLLFTYKKTRTWTRLRPFFRV
jgi:hypothetical protein